MKIVSVVGTRPNLVKIAPLCQHISARYRQGIQHILIHTGQHYDDALSGAFIRELQIPPPDVQLHTGSGTHAAQTARIMAALEPVLVQEQPDWIIVPGDVNSSLAATLVAVKLNLKVAHLEAGLRSFDRSMPEEINRIITDSVSDLLLTPSAEADHNLLREGIAPQRIRRVGNIMVDTLNTHLHAARNRDILERLAINPGEYCYVTLHRPSNVDNAQTLNRIFESLRELSQQLTIIFPVHPRTLERINNYCIPYLDNHRIKLIAPVAYLDSIKLLDAARFVLTDSGGLQEESTCLGKPCLTLRENTERPITLTHGTNRLTRPETLSRDMAILLEASQGAPPALELWDGKTAERIIKALLDMGDT
ncbi:MAG: non-hydrolyzing UDP-N-acetylglucosamine 2-epimerase [Methylococcaceae bacterium]